MYSQQCRALLDRSADADKSLGMHLQVKLGSESLHIVAE